MFISLFPFQKVQSTCSEPAELGQGLGADFWRYRKGAKIENLLPLYPSIFGPSADPDVGCKQFKLRKGECHYITFSLVVLRQIRHTCVVDRDIQLKLVSMETKL